MVSRAIIGDVSRVVSEVDAGVVRFRPGDIAFHGLATYLTALQGFFGLADIYDHTTPTAPWAHDDVAIFDAAACDVRLIWNPFQTVFPMTRNAWPHQIEFAAYEAKPIQGNLNLGVLEHYMYGLGQLLLVNMVENQKPLLKQRFGSTRSWPPVWNFARVVRNAMSHGGQLAIEDRAQVSWKRLSYSDADNGRRRIINVDLWPADLIILVEEMQRAMA